MATVVEGLREDEALLAKLLSGELLVGGTDTDEYGHTPDGQPPGK